MNEIKNHGLILPKITNREEGVDHVLGAEGVPGAVIKPDGDWSNRLSPREPQRKNATETNACTIYGSNSAEESLVEEITGAKINNSDRYPANVAKNRGILNPSVGADPHKIAEMKRTVSGNVPEERCPWTDDINTVDKYYSIVGAELANLMFEGYKWYKTWKFNHAWVFTGGTPQEKRIKLQDALTKGTVCVSVYAWQQKDGLYFKTQGATDNHWVQLVSAKGDEPYKIFDSYDAYIKTLDPLYDFAVAKVYYLTPVSHVFLKNLGFQMMDEEVRNLQKALVSLGYPIPHAVTNVYGTETRSAVHAFQRDNGIIGNFGNNFGPKTRHAMNTKLNPTEPFGGSFLTYLGSFFSQS